MDFGDSKRLSQTQATDVTSSEYAVQTKQCTAEEFQASLSHQLDDKEETSDTELIEELVELEGILYKRRVKKRTVRSREIVREFVASDTPPLQNYVDSLPMSDVQMRNQSATQGVRGDKPLLRTLSLQQYSSEQSDAPNDSGDVIDINALSFTVRQYMQCFGVIIDFDPLIIADATDHLSKYFQQFGWQNEEMLDDILCKNVSYVQRYAQQLSTGGIEHRSITFLHSRKERSLKALSVDQSEHSQKSFHDTINDSGVLPRIPLIHFLTRKSNGAVDKQRHHSDILKVVDPSPFVIVNEGNSMRVLGGCLDALIAYATSPLSKDFIFPEIFVSTYRCFITPEELIDKLIFRYDYFMTSSADLNITTSACTIPRDRVVKPIICVLIRVVNELGSDLSKLLFDKLMSFQKVLLSHKFDEFAKLLCVRVEDQCKRLNDIHIGQSKTSDFKSGLKKLMPHKKPTLLTLSAKSLAEQMTLMDATHFNKIELEDMIKFSCPNDVERIPTLNKFIQHSNVIHNWALSLLLSPERKNAAEIEKYLLKFADICKNLLELNNFSSYSSLALALMNAQEETAIRQSMHSSTRKRLDDLTNLMNPSSNFKNYREALDKATQNLPLIPYLGVIMMYMIHMHDGISDVIVQGDSSISMTSISPAVFSATPVINMWKYWKMFGILHLFVLKRKQVCGISDYKCAYNDEVSTFLRDSQLACNNSKTSA